ncbi:MAG: nigerose phosphorylase [Carnobacterium sp.]|uniref:glycosyl hydrolase family 65 protein n=1 Tax=Carnobacterium sp. TaxID=48221 RepID=UPI0026498659|nr:glycosyl hydrolase family 65 protein [Carnobacterium sp.]MDN5372137.1 nigerose phosphorylase [Carnobacterium sp.]
MSRVNWTIEEGRFQKEQIINFGNKFMTANGYMGFRGTMEEYRKEQFVACNLLGVYDQHEDLWREPINAPNGLYTSIAVDGKEYSLPESEPITHSQSLDIYHAEHHRKTSFLTNDGKLMIKSERFVSAADEHLICLKYSFVIENKSMVTLTTGIDGDNWDINGPHLYHHTSQINKDTILVSALTGELNKTIAVADTIDCNFDAKKVEIMDQSSSVFRKITIEAEAGKEYIITKTIAVYTSNDDVENVTDAAWRKSETAIQVGYEKLKEKHRTVWENRWATSDVEIEGDDEAQIALRYSLYQLQIIAPHHSDKASIPARGLSGQTYKGAVFWDTEMFMLPFFLYTEPKVARNIMQYRVHTLEGARKKAEEYGFRGAFYAWESQENGQDACSDFNITDVFTNRPMRTYFRDKQVHISADVVYGLWQAFFLTGDESILLDGGAEVILECARFFYSYSHYKSEKQRFEVIDVIGPDEYHERVYNNAYTNKMIEFTLTTALKVADILKEKYPQEYETLIDKIAIKDDLKAIKQMKENFYMPQPDSETKLIEQFDDYFKLEDCSLEEIKKRILDPKEYWGGAYGVASDTQIIKQADIVLMLNLFKDEYSQEVKKKNWEYYEPRTEHGSSLSPCIYALLACDIGNQEWAYPYFMKTASVDLTGESKQFAGTIYIGGTHPAANGGAWMAAVLGFGGLKVNEGEIQVTPRLPKKWKKLTFKIIVQEQWYHIEITKEEIKIHKL